MLKQLYKYSPLIFFCLLLNSKAGAQNDLRVLNLYKYLVVKPSNIHVSYSDQQKDAITAKFRDRGFNSIIDQSAMYSPEYKPCDIITCEFNLIHNTGSSPELVSELKFFDCNYTLVFSSTEKNKVQFLSEKNVLKLIQKHLWIANFYTYTYSPKPAEPEKQIAQKAIEPDKSNTEVVAEEQGLSAGKYYALLIGVSDYDDPLIADLDNLPILDAEKLATTLQKNYTFEKDDIKTLKNPSRRDIVIALDEISKTAGENDNVLIFYAGHGHYEEDSQVGYWLPKDAEVSNTSNWLYNDQLVINLKKIKSKHTLLISDACFSGSIFKSRSISLEKAGDALKKKYELPSRKAITSGTLKTVPNVSVFMKYLIDRLEHNFEDFLSASQLFQAVEIPVGNNSPTTPQYGVIQNIGDEGGDFIFIRR